MEKMRVWTTLMSYKKDGSVLHSFSAGGHRRNPGLQNSAELKILEVLCSVDRSGTTCQRKQRSQFRGQFTSFQGLPEAMYLGSLVEWSHTATVHDLNRTLAPKCYHLQLSC